MTLKTQGLPFYMVLQDLYFVKKPYPTPITLNMLVHFLPDMLLLTLMFSLICYIHGVTSSQLLQSWALRRPELLLFLYCSPISYFKLLFHACTLQLWKRQVSAFCSKCPSQCLPCTRISNLRLRLWTHSSRGKTWRQMWQRRSQMWEEELRELSWVQPKW